MHVVQLARYRNRKVVAVARELLQMAEEGDLRGLSFVAKLGPRDHRAGVVGEYRDRPEEAVFAALRMKQALMEEGED